MTSNSLGFMPAAAWLVSLASLILPCAAAENDSPFRFKAVSERSLGLWENEHPVLVYNYGVITNATAPRASAHSGYFHPVYGLDGEVLTDDFPKDHLYHRGLYWAWPHIEIKGSEYDLWSIRGIRIEFQRWLARQAAPGHALLGIENGWFVGEKQVMRETVWLRVHRAESNSRSIDLQLAWTPVDNPITLWGAPGKSYGGLNFRFAPRSRTIITIPSGRSTDDLLMTKLPWADLAGNLGPGGELSGAAIFVHPEHSGFPPEWMTRHYGLLSVGYPGVTAKAFPTGQTFTCSYRIWIHRGNPSANEIEAAYKTYSSSPAKVP